MCRYRITGVLIIIMPSWVILLLSIILLFIHYLHVSFSCETIVAIIAYNKCCCCHYNTLNLPWHQHWGEKLIAFLWCCILLLIAGCCSWIHWQIILPRYDNVHGIFIIVVNEGLERIRRIRWNDFQLHGSFPTGYSRGNSVLLSGILSRHRAEMHPPAEDDNGTLGPYWPVSRYRCAIPSDRSPPGCSNCLHLLLAVHPPYPILMWWWHWTPPITA